jgi:two-component system, LytTR family, response regulator
MLDTIRAVIVDDMKHCIILLTKMLNKSCPSVEIVGTAQSVEEGILCINEHKPDLVFLDIDMPDGDGFEIIEHVEEKSFEVIFITAFDKYAMKAFEISALHYLLKPININDLKEAVKRFEDLKFDNGLENRIKVLNENLANPPTKIVLPTADTLSIYELDDIIRLESFNNYTTFYLVDKQKITVCKPINSYEELLSDLQFFRTHSKHLINMKFVRKYIKGRGGFIVLEDGIHVEVSEGKKKEFLKRLGLIARF